MVKKATKQEEKQANTVLIKIYSEVLIDKRYEVGTHEISEQLRSEIETKSIVKKGIIQKQ